VRVGLLLVLAAAAVLRWTGLDWDDYHHFHPDERYIQWVATTIDWPEEWRTAFDPQQSSFNPYYWPPDAASVGIVVPRDEPRKFAYGHLPLYLAVAATGLANWAGGWLVDWLPADWLLTRDILNGAGWGMFWQVTAVSRALTGLFDLGTILFTFLLGRKLYNPAVGLLAAAFLAVTVLHIQLAHFFTVDPYLTFFTVGAIYFMVKSADPPLTIDDLRLTIDAAPPAPPLPRSLAWFVLAAIFVGLAVGAKFAAVLLFLPLALTGWLVFGGAWWKWGGTAVVAAFLAFFLTNPFAVLDWSCEVITPAMQVGPVTIPRLNWASCYLDNITTQSVMVGGGGNIPFTRQYAGTLPYLYFIEMQLKWGMGWPLGLVAFAGFSWAIWQFFRRLEIGDWRVWRRANLQSLIANLQSPANRQSLIVLAWTVPFFLVTGNFFVKFMRYLQPLTPFLMIYGAALLWQIGHRWGRRAAIGGVLALTALYALAFVNIYREPHPWVVASEWIFGNARPGSLILSEQWDDSLPVSLTLDGERRLRGLYPNEELTWLSGVGTRDSEAKLAKNLNLLAEADYLTLASNRAYGVVPRLPEQYPLSSQYHQLLFDGSLGYELVWVNGRSPHLSAFHYRPDTFGWPGLEPPEAVWRYLVEEMPGLNGGRVDESFVVYDQPLVLIFRNNGRLSAEEMRGLFE
jgi:hypothetical protein